MFIGLTHLGDPVIFNIKNISIIVDCGHCCHIYVDGNPNPFNVDQSMTEIQKLLKKAVTYEF